MKSEQRGPHASQHSKHGVDTEVREIPSRLAPVEHKALPHSAKPDEEEEGELVPTQPRSGQGVGGKEDTEVNSLWRSTSS